MTIISTIGKTSIKFLLKRSNNDRIKKKNQKKPVFIENVKINYVRRFEKEILETLRTV